MDELVVPTPIGRRARVRQPHLQSQILGCQRRFEDPKKNELRD
ncbi:hypothetical protein RSSM_01009 [Rhodopirellula sallentina SM41]|uniref:Uncharacterized protein n=1 Tax=Rhodopirellula sallentina SM41 TaxID=1263870 RepID=M5UNH5_9BACT|nr:hypothetical protein RSSM_01009 [Rhodopirellula sallentina SM41]